MCVHLTRAVPDLISTDDRLTAVIHLDCGICWDLFCPGYTVRRSFIAVIYSPQGHTLPLVAEAMQQNTRARPRVEHCRFEMGFHTEFVSAEIEQMCEQSYL